VTVRPIIASSSCALMLAFAACTEDVGYVEIKVAPGFVLPPILLGTSRIDPARGEGAVLREPVGTARLQFERDGRLIPFCEFDVRKDRIVTVAVSAFGRDPRCKVQG
jgi:hypothetical protein